VSRLVATGFTVSLAELGRKIDAPPGLAVRAIRGEKSLEPFRLVEDMVNAPDHARWAAMCAENGL